LDEHVTEIALTATASQAARVFRSFRVVEQARRRRCGVDADTASSDGGDDRRDGRGPATWWRHRWGDHGFLNVDGRLDPTGGAELAAAIAGTGPGAGVLGSAQRVDARVVRSWLGGSRLDVLVHDGGRPLWLGRRQQRVASPAQRRALLQRDHGCAYPGCGHTRYVDVHRWEHGGPTDIDDLVLLCRRHHRLLHTGHFTITAHDGRPRFLDPSGHPIGTTGRSERPPPPLRRPPDPHRIGRSAEPLTHYGIDVCIAHLLGSRPAFGHRPG
jgi:hypothetical protein